MKQGDIRQKTAAVQPRADRKGQTAEWLFCLFPIAAAVLTLLYIRSASCDVVYSDYIRLVRSYLPDTLNPKKFFVADVLSRIPFTYLARWVNVTFFGYSLTFDRVLGVLGLLFSGIVLMRYTARMRLGALWALLLTAVLFSLNKWEMLLNGSGYAHFIAFGFFFWHYLVIERVYTGQEKPHDRTLLCVLPWIVTVGLAGPYCAVYTVSVVLAYLYMMFARRWTSSGIRNDVKNDRKNGIKNERRGRRKSRLHPENVLLQRNNLPQNRALLRWSACAVIPLLLYMLSDHFAVYEHAGAKDIGLMEAVTTQFSFFPKFLLNGLASMLVGGEELEALMRRPDAFLTARGVYLLGAFVAALYLLAIVLFVRLRLYKKTLFPAILLTAGMGNHAVVMLGRYIFLDADYAWASRYALQYQEGIIGILLIFALGVQCFRQRDIEPGAQAADENAGGILCSTLLIAASLLILAGNGYTTYRELKKAPYREENYEKIAQGALNWRQLDDEALAKLFEFRNGADRIREAMEILEDNHLNIFRGKRSIERKGLS